MHHMDFIIEITGVLFSGVKVSIFQKSEISKIYWFLVYRYDCIKRDKSDCIASMLM